MKTKAEINRLLILANKQTNRALLDKMEITKSTYGYAEKLRDANLRFITAAATANALKMILDSTPLTPEDERYFLSICG